MIRSRGLALAGTLAVVLAACSSGASTAPSTAPAPSVAPSVAASPSAEASAAASPSPSAAALVVPDRIKTAGTLIVCSDVSYAPEEFYAADGTTIQGSDIDIAKEIAKRWSVSLQVDNTPFDGIIAALKAKKCDMILSGMNSTDERKKEVDFVDYLKVGQGLLVPAGNPKNIKTLDDLSGKAVAVQLGTSNKETLDAKNTELKAAGKAGIDIVGLEKDTDAFQQLALGRVDAYSTDSPVVAYYNSLPDNKGKFEIGGTPIDPIAIGVAMRKDDPGMKDAVQAVIDAIYSDGTLKTILATWGMTDAVVLLK